MPPRASHTRSRHLKRPTVAVVHDDPTAGYRCADWLALHGYEATVTSASDLTEGDMKELRPDLIVVGMPTTPSGESHALPRLRHLCPEVPIIAMIDECSDPTAELSVAALAKAYGADVFMCQSLEPHAGPS